MQFESVLNEMDAFGLQPNKQTYEVIVDYYAAGDNVEMALRKLNEMQEQGHSPSLLSLTPIIESLANFGHIQLALDIIEAHVGKNGRHLPGTTWLKVLLASADNLNVSIRSASMSWRVWLTQR